MIYQVENENRKIYVHIEGIAYEKYSDIIDRLHELFKESDEEEGKNEIAADAAITEEPTPKEEKVWKGWPAPPTKIADQIDEETAVAMDSVTVPPITDDLVNAFAQALPAIEQGREKLEEERLERYHEATTDVEETVRILHSKGATDRNYKISEDGRRVMYQCYYKCPVCENKGKRFVLKYAKTTSCHQCKKNMAIKPSITGAQFPTVDQYGNVFVAGDWLPVEAPGESRLSEFKFAKFG